MTNNACVTDSTKNCEGVLNLQMSRPSPSPSSLDALGLRTMSSDIASLTIKTNTLHQMTSCNPATSAGYPVIDNNDCVFPNDADPRAASLKGRSGQAIVCPDEYAVVATCMAGPGKYCGTAVTQIGCCKFKGPLGASTWRTGPMCNPNEVLTGICALDPNSPSGSCLGDSQCTISVNQMNVLFNSVPGSITYSYNTDQALDYCFYQDLSLSAGTMVNCNFAQSGMGFCSKASGSCPKPQLSCCTLFP
jgi:hypothetical protein